MSPVKQRASVGLLLVLCAAPLPAAAHHSFAMFDRDKTESIAGTVKEVSLINPHSWVSLMVPDAQGHSAEWALETGAPRQLERNGWADRVLPSARVIDTNWPP